MTGKGKGVFGRTLIFFCKFPKLLPCLPSKTRFSRLVSSRFCVGFVKLYFEWDWPGAEAEFNRAIAVDPNYAATHKWYSIYLLA